jgi:hypothetical protein
MEIFADTSAFNAGVKEKNTKANKSIIVKNRKQFLEGAYAGCLTLRSYFYPTSLTFGDDQIR